MLEAGLQGKDMDDRWNIKKQEEDVYVFERSWTGDPIYKIVLEGNEVVEALTTINGEGADWNDFHTNFINNLLDLFFAKELSPRQ